MAASLRYGERIRLTQKPGWSATTMTVLPIRRPNRTAVTIASGAVASVGMTSSSGIFSTGEKKCMPSTRSGRRASAAMSRIGMVDVLLAKIVSGRATASTSASTCRLSVEVLEHRLDHEVRRERSRGSRSPPRHERAEPLELRPGETAALEPLVEQPGGAS